MRSNLLLGTRTYPLAISLRTTPIDLWTLCSVTDSLQDGGLAGVRSSNNEDSELDIARDSGYNGIAPRRLGRGLTHPLNTMPLR
jgi:hypothetical protein